MSCASESFIEILHWISQSRDQIIRILFKEGYQYQLILAFLVAVFGICISIRTLKRSLRRQGLKRRNVDTNLQVVGQCLMVGL